MAAVARRSSGSVRLSCRADLTKQGDIEYWQGKDSPGPSRSWSSSSTTSTPNGKVTFHELPDEADQQRQQMIQNTQIKNPKMGVDQVDVVWTAEFAAKGYVVAAAGRPVPDRQGSCSATVDSATYFDKLYAYPTASDGGLLYYRKDLLDKYDLQPPTTLDEMKAACDKIKAGENDDKLDCYAGQYNKYEGLTVNFDEAVHGAGGVIVGDDGKPNVATPEADQGPVRRWSTGSRTATSPRARSPGRGAGPAGVPERHADLPPQLAATSTRWPTRTTAPPRSWASSTSRRCRASPDRASPAWAVHNYAIATNAENKGTAADFIKFMAAAEQQKSSSLATSSPRSSERCTAIPTS